MPRYTKKRILQVDKSAVSCVICGKVCKGDRSLKSHITQMHNGVKDTSHRGRPTGVPAWNRGLTKETDLRVQQYATSSKGKPGSFAGRKHSEETKRKIGEKLSINNKGGRAKWYEVAGQKVQGTWERNVALKFEELGIQWKKLKTNKDTLEYIMDGKVRHYTPDFYLPDYDVLLEIKGHWWGRDREKMDIVLQTHTDKNIVIVEQDQYEKILQGELVWSFQRQTENL